MKKTLILIAFALAPAALFGQNIRYDNVAFKPQGGYYAGANVAVCQSPASGSAPCTNLATIYTSQSGGTTEANPITTDSYGNYGFWADPGHYVVQIYGGGITTSSYDVFLPCDASLTPGASGACAGNETLPLSVANGGTGSTTAGNNIPSALPVPLAQGGTATATPKITFGNPVTLSAPLQGLQDNGVGGQVYNVKAYGATGNGTTDDEPAIGLAIAAAAASGGQVLVPPGNYLLNEELDISSGVNFHLEAGAILEPNANTGSNPNILTENYAWLNGPGPGAGSGGTNAAVIRPTASAAGSAALQVGPLASSGIVQYLHASGITVDGEYASKTAYSTAFVYYANGGQPSRISDMQINTVQGASYPGLLMQGGDGGQKLDTVEVNGGAPACYFNGSSSSENVYDVDASNLSCEHATNATTGSANYPQIELNGNGTNFNGNCHGIDFYHLTTEGLSTDSLTEPLMLVKDCNSINIFGYEARPEVSGSTQYALQIAQTVSRGVYDLNVFGLVATLAGYQIDDTINTKTFAPGLTGIGFYQFPDTGGGEGRVNNFADFGSNGSGRKGVCTFAASTTCSVGYSPSAASIPVVVITPVNPGAVTFALTSSTTSGFTITASASNSLSVNYVVYGLSN